MHSRRVLAGRGLWLVATSAALLMTTLGCASQDQPMAARQPQAQVTEEEAPTYTPVAVGVAEENEKATPAKQEAEQASDAPKKPVRKQMTDEEKRQLAELIRKSAERMRAESDAKKAPQKKKPEPAKKPAKATPANAPAKPQADEDQADKARSTKVDRKSPTKRQPRAAQKKKGCGDASANAPMAEIDPEGPQPKLVVEEASVNAEPVWAGSQAAFEFVLSNGGEAPLDIRLKGG